MKQTQKCEKCGSDYEASAAFRNQCPACLFAHVVSASERESEFSAAVLPSASESNEDSPEYQTSGWRAILAQIVSCRESLLFAIGALTSGIFGAVAILAGFAVNVDYGKFQVENSTQRIAVAQPIASPTVLYAGGIVGLVLASHLARRCLQSAVGRSKSEN